MIKIISYKVGISPKLYIQKLIDMLSMENGKIIIKVQNKKFIHLNIEPSLTPDELDATEIGINEK